MSTAQKLLVRLFLVAAGIVIVLLAWNALQPSGEIRAITPRGELSDVRS